MTSIQSILPYTQRPGIGGTNAVSVKDNLEQLNKTPKSIKLVVSLTTIPSRLTTPRFIQVLQKLHQQTKLPDAIYLSIPKHSRKLNKPYPNIPAEVRKYCKIVPSPVDYGPITKIIGAVLSEQASDTIIVTCDDDVFYPNTFLEEMYNKSLQYPNSAIASSGLIIGSFPGYFSFIYNQAKTRNNPFMYWQLHSGDDPTPVDILFGFSGIAYRRNFFPARFEDIKSKLLDYVFKNEDIFLNDDFLLSCYLNSQNIERYVFKLSDVDNKSGPDAISGQTVSFAGSMVRALMQCGKWGMIKSRVPINWRIRLFHNFTFTSIFILVVCVFAIYLIFFKRNTLSYITNIS